PGVAARHVLPGVLPKTLTLSIMKFPSVMVSVAAYSFLGFSAQPPTADWGVMLADGRFYLSDHPLLVLWPTLTFFVLVLALTRLGESFRNR
ncbi:MAG: hypothetical protein LBF41_03355, partial [Deltaproteobacteria bacterium]|nr:hypothetical protein [Deltaproteobacteria bacterium]